MVRIRNLVESFAVDDNIKTSDIRVPAASPPLIPVVQGFYRRQASTPNRSVKRQTPRSYSEQGYAYQSESPRPRYASANDFQPGYFGAQGTVRAHLLPAPSNVAPNQIYPSFHDMNALYHQQSMLVSNYYSSPRPRTGKGPMFLMNGDYSYGYPNYVVYPSYMPGPSTNYSVDYTAQREKAGEKSASPKQRSKSSNNGV